jgi:hypothetical protein
MSLSLTLATAKATEQPPVSRFRLGSPCRFIRTLDLVVHIFIPKALRPYEAPHLAGVVVGVTGNSLTLAVLTGALAFGQVRLFCWGHTPPSSK